MLRLVGLVLSRQTFISYLLGTLLPLMAKPLLKRPFRQDGNLWLVYERV